MAQVGHREVAQRRCRGAQVNAGMKEHLDDADAGQRARFDVLDVAAKGEEPLEAGRDVRLHIHRRHARIKSGDDYDRDVETGKNVDRHAAEMRRLRGLP